MPFTSEIVKSSIFDLVLCKRPNGTRKRAHKQRRDKQHACLQALAALFANCILEAP